MRCWLGFFSSTSPCSPDAAGRTTLLRQELRAEHIVGLTPDGYSNIKGADRVGEWTRQGEILTAWVRITFKKGKPYVYCASVDIAQRIDNDDDIPLAIALVDNGDCKGPKPKP